MADVTLSASIRSNLLSLNNTADLVNQTNSRLSTGKKVSSAIDDAVSYFQAKGLSDRAGDMSSRKASIDQGISTLKSAIGGLEASEKILTQMKGVVLSAKSANESQRADLAVQLSNLATQLNLLANDTTYQGLNLINSTASNIKVQFSDQTAAVLQVDGADVRVSQGFVLTGMQALQATNIASLDAISSIAGVTTFAGFSDVSASVSVFDSYVAMFDSGISFLRSTTQSVGGNVALLQTRLDFTKQYVNTLTEGAGKLTLSDLNEEGANLVSLQTRQQLGIQALSNASQAEQAVLRLFG